MKKRNILQITFLALCATLCTSCTNEEETIAPAPPAGEPVLLQVHTGIELTRSAIQGSTDASTVGAALDSIAVYANSATQHSATNNYSVYKWDTSAAGAWVIDGKDSIKLTGETAKIYAHYPAYKMNNDGTADKSSALKPTSAAPYIGSSTIAISVFEKDDVTAANHTITPVDNADKDSGGNDNVSGKGKLATAPGDIDYMYADTSTAVTATATSPDVTLNMKHALSMVSFRAYNDGTYNGIGLLTKIMLKNSNNGTALDKGTSPAMQLNGILVKGVAAAATYTRLIGTNDETLVKATTTDIDGKTLAKEKSKKFGILVLPDEMAGSSGTAGADKSSVNVVLTIDGVDYTTALPNTGATWVQGKNYLYTLKLSGAGLSVTSVMIADWTTETAGSDLEIK